MSATPASTGSGATPGHHKPLRILACVLCQHRKIKCDRTFPCANCVKANVTCTPSTPAPARKRRRPNQDLQERLARCEQLLKEYATEKPDAATPTSSGHHSDTDDIATPVWQPTGKLVEDDGLGGPRFMDSMLLSTVFSEVQTMRQIIDEEENEGESPDPSTATEENAELVMPMGSDSGKVDLDRLRPQPGQIFRLWQMYLERVNPLTKIIHVPTLQPYLVDATIASKPVPQSVEALLFAIYTLATVSMSNDECMNMLGCPREAALQRFSAGTRYCLNRLNYLSNYSLETIQALTIYMISLQGRCNRHAAWVLNGIAIRVAQKMGLHRDGETLGLSPFETEMRRRVWWQIAGCDFRYSIMSGLTHALLPAAWDTKMPKNINDADLFPSATEPIQDREGPTEMIMVLITSRVTHFMASSPSLDPLMLLMPNAGFEGSVGGGEGPSPEFLASFRKMLTDLTYELFEIIDRFCDPSAGPLHEMVRDVKLDIKDKMAMFQQPNPDFANLRVKDGTFKLAIYSMQHGIDNIRNALSRGFAWFARMHVQTDLQTYIAGQLIHRTDGEDVDKAWQALADSYELVPDCFDVSQKKYAQLGNFVLRAWRTREAALRQRFAIPPPPPEFVMKLQTVMPQVDYKSPTPGVGIKTDFENHLDDGMLGANTGMDDTLGAEATADQLLNFNLSTPMEFDVWGNMMPAGSVMSAFAGFGMGSAAQW